LHLLEGVQGCSQRIDKAHRLSRPMNVSYVAPFQRAWWRVERMLFHPFTLQMWLTLGLPRVPRGVPLGRARYGFRTRQP